MPRDEYVNTHAPFSFVLNYTRAILYGVRYAVAKRLVSQVFKMAKHSTFISPLEGSRFNPVWSATSQGDYQSYFGAERVEAIPPPPPASVLHRDAKYLNFGTSLSRSTYCVPPLCERAAHIDRHKMYATNFSLSANAKAAVVQTTNRHFHHPIAIQRTKSTKKETRNPLGVGLVLPSSESEYVGSFAVSLTGNAMQRDEKCVSHRDPILGEWHMYAWANVCVCGGGGGVHGSISRMQCNSLHYTGPYPTEGFVLCLPLRKSLHKKQSLLKDCINYEQ